MGRANSYCYSNHVLMYTVVALVPLVTKCMHFNFRTQIVSYMGLESEMVLIENHEAACTGNEEYRLLV